MGRMEMGLAIALAMNSVSAPVPAQYTGSNYLEERCLDNDNAKFSAWCFGYVGAMVDMLQETKSICPNETLSIDQFVDIIKIYVRENVVQNPAMQDLSASAVVWIALESAFPCATAK